MVTSWVVVLYSGIWTDEVPHVLSTLRLREDIGTSLSSPKKEQLASLFEDNKDIFTQGGEPTPFAIHQIDTGEARPIAVLPYRVSPEKEEVRKRQIDKMLAEGIIKVVESEWISPVIILHKYTTMRNLGFVWITGV